MSLNAYDLSAGLFIRGLTNLKNQLAKTEEHAAATGSGEVALLDARLGPAEGAPGLAPRDLHRYTLADQVHWAAEGAKLAITQLLGARPVPTANDAKSFAALHQRIDATIAYLGKVSSNDLESGLDRTIVIEHPRGSTRASGRQFLLAFAIPHFFYHVTTAYGILRNQGVPLTMSDFLGNWGTS
jgi:hypothetical protein